MQGIADQLGIGLGAATRLLVRLGLANVERAGLAALSGLEKGA